MKYTTRIYKTVKSNRGSVVPLTVALVCAVLLTLAVSVEYLRLVIIANGVRDALSSAANGASTDNYETAYSGLREGHTGGYDEDGELLLTEKELHEYLIGELGVGTDLVKKQGEMVEYSLTNVAIEIVTTEHSPTDPVETITVYITATLNVPIRILVERSLSIPLRVISNYTLTGGL